MTQRIPLVALLFGIAFLLLLFYFLIYVPEPSVFQRQIARVSVAFAAGFLAYFIVGSIVITGNIWGLDIRATSGFALFVCIMFLYDPFLPPAPKGQPTYYGKTLGGLVALVEEAYAAQETTERIILEPGQTDQLRNFALQQSNWTGQTWVQLAQRVCDVHSCLQGKSTWGSRLRLALGRASLFGVPESITIRIVGGLEKRCLDAECLRYTYSCRP